VKCSSCERAAYCSRVLLASFKGAFDKNPIGENSTKQVAGAVTAVSKQEHF